MLAGSSTGPERAGRHQRAADCPERPPVAQRVIQSAPVVRLRLRPQVGPLAQSSGQPDRGAGKLLQDGGVPTPDPGRGHEQADATGPGLTSRHTQSGRKNYYTIFC